MPTASCGPVIGPGPGRPAFPGPSAALVWLTPASARRPGPSWFGPAARLAREGFPISADLAGSLNRQLAAPDPERPTGRRRDDFGRLGDFPESVAAFGKPDRTPWKEGDRLIQRDLAATLDRIAANGPDEFYTGRTAQLIASYMAEHGGFVTLDDLKSYQAKLRPPVHTTFRGFDVYSIGPSSSGGIVLCQMLNILERFDLKADGRESPRTLHRVTEAMRRAFYTRATQLADPDFVTIPVEELTSKAYADKLARSIGEKATPSQDLASFTIQSPEGDHTTHLSSLDQAGNAVALTYTLEDSYGAKCVVAGAGFLLNNEMGDFNLIPGRTDSTGRIGTPRQPDCAPQADAQLANPDVAAQGRPGAGGHGLAGRTHHPQHGPVGRAQSGRVWIGTERGRRRAADPPSVVSRRPGPRRSILGRDNADCARLHGAQAGHSRAPGQCQHHRR